VLFEDLETDSALRQALEQVASVHKRVKLFSPEGTQAHWWIDLPATMDDYLRKFSRKTRYNLKRTVDMLEHSCRRFTSSDDVATFLEKAHRVSQVSWQSKARGLRVNNTPALRAYFERFAALGAFRSYVLEQNDRPLAFAFGFQWKGCYTYEEVGFDPEYQKYSPGKVLFFRLLEDLIANDPPSVLDFGYGDSDYKQLFGTRQTRSGPVILARRDLRPLTGLHWQQFQQSLRKRVRRLIERLGLLEKLRKLRR
jgi:CelD/BcsL family acetyltransferase involved in cellulose biosynthesis